ncbi:hypothetical protein EDD16DRAFT_1699035 [Pisolithus croceorrhizus]|nr:hypothetical protein EDD16DRAFT_1699035 [Pisolithus croceorrhizus]KAI6159349.1 hypothetical protein EDD17DRAFT_1778943 [Pisolithus thermaeus]
MSLFVPCLEHTKLKGLLEVVSLSAEFEVIPICWHEDIVLCQIYDHAPIKLDHPGFEAPYFKMFLLLQAYFLHIQLLFLRMLSLLSACVDVGLSNTWLGATDLLQMCVQALVYVAMSVNSNLTLDVSYKLVKDEYMADAPISTGVSLAQGTSEGDPNHVQTVVAPFYPLKKMENWWLVVGQPSMCQLHVTFNIKHVTVSKSCP